MSHHPLSKSLTHACLAILQSTNHEWIHLLFGLGKGGGFHFLFPLEYGIRRDNRKVFSESQHPEHLLAWFPCEFLFLWTVFSYNCHQITGTNWFICGGKLCCLLFWPWALFVSSCLDSCVWWCAARLEESRLHGGTAEGAPSSVTESRGHAGTRATTPPHAVTPHGLVCSRSRLGSYLWFLGWLFACPLLATDSVIQTWLQG